LNCSPGGRDAWAPQRDDGGWLLDGWGCPA